MMRKLLLSAIAMLLCLQSAFAIDSAPAFTDPAMQARYDVLIRELRCVQCRSQSIADSNVFLAADLRRQVREQMAAGKSDKEILSYMTDRYGEYILYTPPVAPRTLVLWAAPALLVLMGAVVAGVVIRRKSRLPHIDPSDPDSAGADNTPSGAA
jgi:cytochrome c-type biogenesis protein CcmH